MHIYMRYPGGLSKALTFSYDDGVKQDKRLVELLDKHKMKGTFNLNSGMFAPEETVFPKSQIRSRRLTKSVCKELYKNHEIAMHGETHPYLDSIPSCECIKDIYDDRVNLEVLTDRFVRGLAYPYGTFSEKVDDILKACGVVYARTVVSTESFTLPENWLRLNPTCHHNNPKLFDLSKEFLDADNGMYRPCMLFYLWGHTFEFDDDNNWNVIEDFVELMSKCKEIWYATNIEIYDYIQKYNQLIFNAKCDMCYNPTDTELFFVANDKACSVKPGEVLNFN